MQRFQGRVILVSGGLGGIGAAVVERYLIDGASVVVLDLDEARGREAQAEWDARRAKAMFIAADVSSFSSCETTLAQAEARFGAVDTLILNAGISPKSNGSPALAGEMRPDEWRRVMGVNLDSCFNLTRLAVPTMKEKKRGWIVATSSVAGKAFLDTVGVHYSTTKGALIAFVRHLAGELGPHGILVNAVAPGRIDTPMLTTTPASANEAIVRQTPLGRLGTPAEVASVCAFLTSSDASFVTGQTIDVAGGWLMT